MTENHQPHAPSADDFGKVRNVSEGFGSVPKASEPFRKLPNHSEGFGSFPNGSERKESHTLTVREVVRMFEAAGVARTERSIINWCQPNQKGIARLDSYFDPNERKYYITPQSVDLAIAEERDKVTRGNRSSEGFGSVPKPSETPHPSFQNDAEPFRSVSNDAETPKATAGNDKSRIEELEWENRDLMITNRAKDQVIEMMQKDRNQIFDQAMAANRKVGELEAKLLSLEGIGPGNEN